MIDGLNNRSFLVSRSFFAGMVSAAVALSVGELFASVSNRSISLVYAVGEFIIDITPGDVVRGSIETLGNYQKVVLLCSIALLSIIFGGILGVLSRRHSEKSYLLFIGFGIFGAWTLNRDPLTTTSAALSLSVSATLIGISSLLFLNSLLSDEEEQNFEDPRNTYANRRQFINWATGMTAAAGTLTGVGRVLLRRRFY